MTKNRLALLLIKKGVTEDQVLESGLNKIQLEDDYHLYYKQMLIKNPKWIDTFLLGNEESKNIFKTQCVSAILTVVLKKIFFFVINKISLFFVSRA